MRPRSPLDALLFLLALVLGVGALLGFGAFLWTGPPGVLDLDLSTSAALLLDAGLSLAFFVQHSGMVRRRVRRRIASSFGAHRAGAVYAIASGLVLAAVVLGWQPVGPTISDLEGPARLAVRLCSVLTLVGLGWVFVALRGVDLLGLAPLLTADRRAAEPAPVLVARGPYRHVRHPAYALSLVLLWAHTTYTPDRFLFAGLWSVWIVAGAFFEERDLEATYGEAYVAYRRRVPMFVPWLRP